MFCAMKNDRILCLHFYNNNLNSVRYFYKMQYTRDLMGFQKKNVQTPPGTINTNQLK